MNTFAYLFTFIFIFMSCGGHAPQSPENMSPTETNSLPSDFMTWYEKFHADSAFQMDHISWPLSGRPSPLDTNKLSTDPNGHFWLKENWKLHKPFNHNAQFERDFEVLSPNLINERSRHTELNLVMLRRFAKTSDGWNLIYYAAP